MLFFTYYIKWRIFPSKIVGIKMALKKLDVDRGFESRNWLGLSRLAHMGYSREEGICIMREIEAGKLSFKDVKGR